ncbi:MAG: HAMP domain-containing protein [Phycisphaerae bacterium]|nr:HAMP domain-containing protein [Gemmatimonadaceae bacterium]
MSWPHEVRWRLTLWYAATSSIGLALFAIGSLVVISRVLNTRADRFLRDARGGFLVELAVESREYPEDADAIRMTVREVRFEETRFAVYDANGRFIVSTAEFGPEALVVSASTAGAPLLRTPVPLLDTAALRRVVRTRSAQQSRTDVLLTVGAAESEYRVMIGGASVHGRPYTVLAVHDRSEHHATMRRVAAAYAFGIPLFLLGAVGGGYFLARRALAPVGAMADRARAIGASTLHERLPVGDARDELGGLARVVNDLLSRLEQAFAQQFRFVADASHELRTPVAILQAESEVALSRENRTEAEYRDALAVMNKSSRRLSCIVEDLFLLARADAGHMPLHAEPLYLDEVLADSVRGWRSVASREGVRIELSSAIDEAGAPFNGSPSLLDRLFLNLLDNAVKHSPRDGVVRVGISRSGKNYEITIADNGPGIPASAQPHIFERFFRVDAARSRTTSLADATDSNADRATAALPYRELFDSAARTATVTSGAGLGLAIAKWIAEAHGGTLALHHASALGTEFVVTLAASEAVASMNKPA